MYRFYNFTIVILIASILVCVGNAHALFKSAKVTLVVVDESGEPIEGADAGVGFEKNTGWDTETKAQRGLTDANGRFVASGNCNGHIGIGARKEGYYRSHYEYDFQDLGMFGWKPWNPELKIVMRKIENPVSMYARHAKIEMPDDKKKIGFDLVMYDWVSPYGKGLHGDFILYLEKKYVDRNNYNGKLIIKFTNVNDGIMKISENFKNGSQYKLPRIAQIDGYQSSLELLTSQDPNGKWIKGFQRNDSYIFRVRSEIKDGKLGKAMYGKIRGPIQFEPRIEPAKVYFTYYINPDYTRNLEFDPKQNLFGNLPDLEQVNEP